MFAASCDSAARAERGASTPSPPIPSGARRDEDAVRPTPPCFALRKIARHASPAGPSTTDRQLQHLSRNRFGRVDDILVCGRLSQWCFHDCQDVPALLGDTPSTFQPLDETLRENLQARYSSGKPLGPLRPILPACRKNCDVTFQIVKAGKAVWIAPQNLENCDLKIHSRTRLGRAALIVPVTGCRTQMRDRG